MGLWRQQIKKIFFYNWQLFPHLELRLAQVQTEEVTLALTAPPPCGCLISPTEAVIYSLAESGETQVTQLVLLSGTSRPTLVSTPPSASLRRHTQTHRGCLETRTLDPSWCSFVPSTDQVTLLDFLPRLHVRRRSPAGVNKTP